MLGCPVEWRDLLNWNAALVRNGKKVSLSLVYPWLTVLRQKATRALTMTGWHWFLLRSFEGGSPSKTNLQEVFKIKFPICSQIKSQKLWSGDLKTLACVDVSALIKSIIYDHRRRRGGGLMEWHPTWKGRFPSLVTIVFKLNFDLWCKAENQSKNHGHHHHHQTTLPMAINYDYEWRLYVVVCEVAATTSHGHLREKRIQFAGQSSKGKASKQNRTFILHQRVDTNEANVLSILLLIRWARFVNEKQSFAGHAVQKETEFLEVETFNANSSWPRSRRRKFKIATVKWIEQTTPFW